jgi:thymidylate synthase (FAD)
VRRQSRSNKQGSETNGFLEQDVAEDFINGVDHINEIAYEYYLDAIHAGVSREQARILLPQTMMVEWYWKIDLHNLFHFLELRMDSHAQKEIRDYAKAVFELLKVVFPVACEAFEDYRLGGMWLSRFEVEAIRNKQERIESSNQTEQNAWFEKKRQLNL